MACEIGSGIQASYAVMADKDKLAVFRPRSHYLLHEFLSKKQGALNMYGIPFLTAPDVNQRKILPGLPPVTQFLRADLRLLIRFMPGDDRVNYLVDWQVIIAFADLR